MVWLGADGRILWANQAQLELLGYEWEEYVGHHVSDSDADGTVVASGLQRLSANQAWHGHRARLRCKDGTIKPVLIDFIYRVLTEAGTLSYAHCLVRDESDASRVSEALRESEAKLTALLANAADAIITIDQSGTIQSFNPAASRIFGYDQDEVIGRNVAMLMPPPDSERHGGYIRHYLETGEKRIIGIGREVVGICKNRRLLNLELSISEIQAGRSPTFMGIVRDVTERKRAERELSEQQGRLNLAMTAGRMGTWEWDIRTEQVRWSATLEEIHGLAPGSFGGTFKDSGKDIHPDDRESVMNAVSKSLKKGAHELEYRIVRPDGETRWLSARGQLAFAEDGQPERMTGICMDITERKRLEEEQQLLVEASTTLAAAELDLPMTMASLARLIVPRLADWCEIDLLEEDGAMNQVVVLHDDPAKVELARALQRKYPFNPRDRSGVAQVLRTGRSELYSHIADSLIDAVVPDAELRSVLRSLRLTSVMCIPLAARGRTLGAITLATAESGRRYTEDDLRFTEEIARRAAYAVDNARMYEALRRAIETKDEFLGLMSHELRTPITAIYGGARMLRYRSARLDQEQRSRILDDIEEESDRLFRMVENLLALGRLELGQRVRTEPLMVQRLITKLVASFSQRKPGRRIRLDLDELEPVAGRATYVEQILRNLLSNADKYSPPESAITVRAKRADGEAHIAVLDRGPGIKAEEKELIFERFFRADRTAGSAAGMGLGLTVCKRMVEAQSGRIWARPRRGGGLEVGFALPLYEEGV